MKCKCSTPNLPVWPGDDKCGCAGSTLDEYQEAAKTTAVFPQMGLIYCTLALNGEAGELAEKVKKIIRDGTYDQNAMALELGDILWYLANCADRLGFTLQEIADMNIAKLADRKKRGKIKGSGDKR